MSKAGGSGVHNDLFPPSPRVAFRRAQLAQAVCQLRFPTVLRIESSPPADFQERVRDRLPYFTRQSQLSGQIPIEIANLFGQGAGGQVSYDFKSDDGKITLNLTPDALTLTTTEYHRWESFKEIIDMGCSALIDVYKPSFFTRIGLRYINIIDKGVLGLYQEKWSSLINNKLLGELVEPDFLEFVEEARRHVRLRNSATDECALFQHGFNGSDTLKYLLDFDFYKGEKVNALDVQPLLDRFHTRAGHAFRWCLQKPLYDALGPIPCD